MSQDHVSFLLRYGDGGRLGKCPAAGNLLKATFDVVWRQKIGIRSTESVLGIEKILLEYHNPPKRSEFVEGVCPSYFDTFMNDPDEWKTQLFSPSTFAGFSFESTSHRYTMSRGVRVSWEIPDEFTDSLGNPHVLTNRHMVAFTFTARAYEPFYIGLVGSATYQAGYDAGFLTTAQVLALPGGVFNPAVNTALTNELPVQETLTIFLNSPIKVEKQFYLYFVTMPGTSGAYDMPPAMAEDGGAFQRGVYSISHNAITPLYLLPII